MKQVAIVVDWYGPFVEDTEAISFTAHNNISHAIYTVIGKEKSKRGVDKIQYIGLSKQTSKRLANHTKIQHVTQNRKIWIGVIGSFAISGQKTKITNTMTDLAEWAHIYFLQPELNGDKKSINPPDRPVTVVNRWWKKDKSTPYIKAVHKDWPTLIEYFGKEFGAYTAWSGNKTPKRWAPNDF